TATSQPSMIVTPTALNIGSMKPLKVAPVGASVRARQILVWPSCLNPTATPMYAAITPAEIGYETVDVNSEMSVPPMAMRGMPAASKMSTTPLGLLNVRSLNVATTPSLTSCRAHETSPLASPLLSHTSATSLAWFVPAPPRLLNALSDAIKASFVPGAAASGPLSGWIMPIFTVGPDAGAECTEAPAPSNGTATAAATAATTAQTNNLERRPIILPPWTRRSCGAVLLPLDTWARRSPER